MRTQITAFLILAASSSGLRAADSTWISFGAKAGAALTDPVSTGFGSNNSRRALVGPTIEFRLPANFALEVSALYQRTGANVAYSFLSSDPATSYAVSQRTTGNSWQFPVVGKYYFKPARSVWRPYVGTVWAWGNSWNHTKGQLQTSSPGTGV